MTAHWWVPLSETYWKASKLDLLKKMLLDRVSGSRRGIPGPGGSGETIALPPLAGPKE